jgi:hypothetical protein
LVVIFKFLRRFFTVVHNRSALPTLLAPCLFQSSVHAKTDMGQAVAFVELLMTIGWDPVFEDEPTSAQGKHPKRVDLPDSGSQIGEALESPALPTLPERDSSDSGTVEVKDFRQSPAKPLDTGQGRFFDEQPTKVGATGVPIGAGDESSTVEMFIQPKSVSLGGPERKPGSGPAWGAEVDQEDVLSSIEFANRPPMLRVTPAPATTADEGWSDFEDDLDEEML